jgi:hypothetical protein
MFHVAPASEETGPLRIEQNHERFRHGVDLQTEAGPPRRRGLSGTRIEPLQDSPEPRVLEVDDPCAVARLNDHGFHTVIVPLKCRIQTAESLRSCDSCHRAQRPTAGPFVVIEPKPALTRELSTATRHATRTPTPEGNSRTNTMNLLVSGLIRRTPREPLPSPVPPTQPSGDRSGVVGLPGKRKWLSSHDFGGQSLPISG